MADTLGPAAPGPYLPLHAAPHRSHHLPLPAFLRTASVAAGLFTLAATLLTAGTLPQPALGQAAVALPEDQGSKGAQVYCFMRKAGNNHEVSWTAAYALLRRQSASLFKTSP